MNSTTKLSTLLISAAALSLSACGDNDEVVETDSMAVDDTLVTTTDEDAYPVAGELSEQQQAGYDAMDAQAISDEYDANRDTMMEEEGASSGDEGATSEADNFTMPSRGEMEFSWLDRNGDGQLSVAEYAIWALPTDPTEPEPNDAQPPYLTQDEINSAGQTFFYFDYDGDSYLSQNEFTAARNSAVTG